MAVQEANLDRVLAVVGADDERSVLAPLERAGYLLTVEEDVDRALESCRRGETDLLLVALADDVRTVALCRRVRTDRRAAFLPVLVHLVDRASVLASMAVGCDDEVLDPVDGEELVARVARVLRRTRQLRAASPLTGLPGNALAERELADRIAAGRAVALVHADLSDFKSYNDRYGLLRGDEVILATRDVLQQAVERHDPDEGFAAHAGGDDFVLLCRPAALPSLCTAAITDFDRMIAGLYDPADRAAGVVRVPNRQGRLRRFPIVRLALGAASTEHGQVSHHRRLVEIAGEMKLYAKRRPVSSWALDRRHLGGEGPQVGSA